MDGQRRKEGKKMQTTKDIALMLKTEVKILNNTVFYELYEVDLVYTRLYIVSVRNSDESAEAVVGKDESCALYIYALICKNQVTPCTFYDVIEDFRDQIQ